MEAKYKEAKNIYKNLVTSIIKESISIVEAMSKKVSPRSELSCRRERSILQYLKPDPKTNFLVITTTNLFTKDEPILRYVPSIKSAQPASINWYEGTVIGEKPFESSNTVDIIFMRMCIELNMFKEARNFLGSNKLFLDHKQFNPCFEDLFCSVCQLFDCGMHGVINGTVLKYNEPKKCICSSFSNKTVINNCTSVLNKENDCNKFKNVYDLPNFKKMIEKYSFKSCVMKKIIMRKLNLPLSLDVSCHKFKVSQFPTKNIRLSSKKSNPKEFFEPCSHKGACNKSNCTCVKAGIMCNLSCLCSNCENIKWCNCKSCDSNCPCFKEYRDCSLLCSNGRHQRNEKSVSVFASAKHGYGLFCEEMVKKDEFVIEYVGEIISDKESERRGNFYEMNKCSYLFNLTSREENILYSVDAFILGNMSRYINHSVSNANLIAEVLITDGLTRIMFYSLRDIYKGEEFLFDYKFSEEHKIKHGIMD